MLSLQHAGKRFGPRVLFLEADWLIRNDEKTALVGANGTGKSTLMKILAGLETLDYGSLDQTRGISIGYLPQEGLQLAGRTVFEECLTVFDELHEMEREIERLAGQMAELDHESAEYQSAAERYSLLQDRFHALDGYALDAQVGSVLTGLGFGKEDWARQTDEFSGGWQMRIALAKLLLAKPNLLLLDEPTNHLDLETRNWLEGYLKNYPFGYILISHDRYFLDVTIDRTVEIWNKRLTIYQGNYTKYLKQKDERREQLMAAYRNQRERIEHLEAFINRFRYQATKAKQVQSRIKELEKIERIEIPEEEPVIHFKFPQPPPSGRIVAEAEGLAKSYGPKQVFSGARFTIERGDRVALVGVNGAGKSTLIKLLTGEEAPTAGSIHLGHNVVAEYFAQDQYKVLDPEARMLDDISRAAARVPEVAAALAAGLLSLFRRRRLQAARRALGRRAQPLRAGAHSGFAVELPAARRADQPPGHARQGRAARSARQLQRHGGLRLARSLLHRSPGHARARNRERRDHGVRRQLRRLSAAERGAGGSPQPRKRRHAQHEKPAPIGTTIVIEGGPEPSSSDDAHQRPRPAA